MEQEIKIKIPTLAYLIERLNLLEQLEDSFVDLREIEETGFVFKKLTDKQIEDKIKALIDHE